MPGNASAAPKLPPMYDNAAKALSLRDVERSLGSLTMTNEAFDPSPSGSGKAATPVSLGARSVDTRAGSSHQMLPMVESVAFEHVAPFKVGVEPTLASQRQLYSRRLLVSVAVASALLGITLTSSVSSLGGAWPRFLEGLGWTHSAQRHSSCEGQLSAFLKHVEMQQHAHTLCSQGYNRLADVLHMTDAQLLDAGLQSPAHRHRIVYTAEQRLSDQAAKAAAQARQWTLPQLCMLTICTCSGLAFLALIAALVLRPTTFGKSLAIFAVATASEVWYWWMHRSKQEPEATRGTDGANTSAHPAGSVASEASSHSVSSDATSASPGARGRPHGTPGPLAEGRCSVIHEAREDSLTTISVPSRRALTNERHRRGSMRHVCASMWNSVKQFSRSGSRIDRRCSRSSASAS